jgi:hypothetical protein
MLVLETLHFSNKSLISSLPPFLSLFPPQKKSFSLSSTFFLLSSGSIAGPSKSNLSASAAEENSTRFSMRGGLLLSKLEEEGRNGGREGGKAEYDPLFASKGEGGREGGKEGGK